MDNQANNQLKAAYERLYEDYNYLLEKNKMLEISVVAAQNGFPAEEYDFVIKHYLKIKHKLKKLLKKQVS